MPNYLCHGFICTYSSIDTENIMIGLVESNECLCIKQDCCLSLNMMEGLGVGMVTEDDEICKIGLYVCRLGLKIPSILCANAAACLCCKAAASFPFDEDYVGSAICAICCVQLYPEVGVMKEAPKSKAIYSGK